MQVKNIFLRQKIFYLYLSLIAITIPLNGFCSISITSPAIYSFSPVKSGETFALSPVLIVLLCYYFYFLQAVQSICAYLFIISVQM